MNGLVATESQKVVALKKKCNEINSRDDAMEINTRASLFFANVLI